MSIQKYADMKRGGETPAGDIKNNDVLKAAAEAGRAALKKIGGAIDQEQVVQKRLTRVRHICFCGDPDCTAGPFTLRQEY